MVNSKVLNMHLLEVENLTKHFGGLVAVDEVTFQVDEGEVLTSDTEYEKLKKEAIPPMG